MKLREEQKLFKEAQKIAKQLRRYDGVSDIEFGLKHQGGELTDEIALRFKVKEKKTERELKVSEILPKKIEKFKTDVLLSNEELHQARIVNQNNVVRPLIGGVQIQSRIYSDIDEVGTLGCFYKIKDRILGFTNYHVLYGGVSHEVVNNYYVDKLPVFQNLNISDNKIGVATNLFDYELDYATFVPTVSYEPEQSLNIVEGIIDSYAFPQCQMPVFKSGAKTKVTYGIIDGRSCVNASEISIYIDKSKHGIDEKISDYGDSGSVWVCKGDENALRLIALHYGGNKQFAKAKSFASIFASIRNKTKSSNLIV